ncbi:alcohol dehydrogenase catalytic domain-containing protein [Streptomyces sp. LZ34]
MASSIGPTCLTATQPMVRRGVAFVSDAEPPYVPGTEAAGVIEQIGPGVQSDLSVGDRVVAVAVVSGTHGAYAEHLVVPAESVVRAPRGASDAEAATPAMNGLTARMALDPLQLPAGATVAVTGAAGAVGGYAVQLAKADGLRVIADAAPTGAGIARGGRQRPEPREGAADTPSMPWCCGAHPSCWLRDVGLPVGRSASVAAQAARS